MGKRFWIFGLTIFNVFCSALCGNAAGPFQIGDADFKLCGSIKLDAGWKISTGDDTAATDDTKIDVLTDLATTAVNLLAGYGNMTGFVELGLYDATTVKLRHAYAIYAIDEANSLLVGQTSSILANHYPKQNFWDTLQLKGAGRLDNNSRIPQICYNHTEKDRAWSIAFQDVNPVYKGPTAAYEVQGFLPSMLGSFSYKGTDYSVTPSVQVQWYKLSTDVHGADDISVLGFAIALDGMVKAHDATIDYSVWYAQNAGSFASNFGRFNREFNELSLNTDGDALEGIGSFGGWLQVGIPIKEVTMYTGVGYQQADIEDLGGTQDNAEVLGLFANCVYEITNGFFIQPEIAFFDKGENRDGIDLGAEIDFGARFQYDF